MALMHDDMRYIHLECDADYDRDLLIDGRVGIEEYEDDPAPAETEGAGTTK